MTKTGPRGISAVVVGSLVVALVALTVGLAVMHARSDHVRWDIISVQFNTPSPGVTTLNPGGVAFAQAPNHVAPATPWRIRLTGSGTFVAPGSGKTSNAVTGGGTWATFVGGTLTGSGTYWVTGLENWQFASLQSPGNVDNIADISTAANGNAVLRIQYSDGATGILGVGCHGPGAPNGIVEGVIATKNFVTYWLAEPPAPGVDLNRTLFHIDY